MTLLEINKKIASMREHDGIDDAHPWDIKKNRFYSWAGSIEDAWELFEEIPTPKSIHHSGIMDYQIWYGKPEPKSGYQFRVRADTASKAICLAWIKWKESNAK